MGLFNRDRKKPSESELTRDFINSYIRKNNSPYF